MMLCTGLVLGLCLCLRGASAWVSLNAANKVLGWKTNKVAKANSYGNFGLGVEFGTWR